MCVSQVAVAFAVALPPFLLVLFFSFRSFDELLRFQVSVARPEWEKMGKPSGYFWKPPESSSITPRLRGYIWSHWFVRRPHWVDSSAESARAYARFRVLGWLAMATFVPVFGSTVLLVMLEVVTRFGALLGSGHTCA